MNDAAENVDKGNQELSITKKKQKVGSRMLLGIFLCAFIFVVLLIALFIWRWNR